MAEPLKIFISYAHADGDGVGRIYQQLRGRGYRPWLDREDILGGEEWEPAIRAGIRGSDLFLLCMSRQSLQRRGVLQKEIKVALDVAEEKLDTDIFLIPVWIQVGMPLPKDDMPERLSRLQWINLTDADGWQRLIRSIEHQSSRLGREAVSSAVTTTGAAADGTGTPVDGDQLVARLRASIGESDGAGVETVVAAIVEAVGRSGHGITSQQATRVVGQLWRRRLVRLVHQVGDAFMLAGIDAPSIRRFYTEALLEQRWLTASFDALGKLEQAVMGDPTERALVADLRGRSHTTAFLDAVRAGSVAADHLWKAVTAYHDAYSSDPRRHLLHGSRAAALVLRATRNGMPSALVVSPRDIATRVLDEVREREDTARPLDIDECEAALHAELVLDRHDRALDRLHRCLDHAQADVVTLRTVEFQLTGVWELRQNAAPGTALLPPVLERLRTVSASWHVADAPPVEPDTASAITSDAVLEQVVTHPEFHSLSWYRNGLACARQVARIEMLDGTAIATGFLLSGAELHSSLPDEPLLVTNSYVVTDDAAVKEHYAFSVLGPGDVRARFQADEQVYAVEVVWSSFEAGTSILRLTPRLERDRRLDIAPRLPAIGRSRAFIIGHPGGRDLEFSMHDNVILDCDDRVVHYRTPTEPGSGGSPVFNALWKVIAIHHAGAREMPRLHGLPGTYGANEGIRIDFVRKTLDAGATKTPTKE